MNVGVHHCLPHSHKRAEAEAPIPESFLNRSQPCLLPSCLGERLKVPGIVQKYAVVDVNHVFAPSGATWGNVGGSRALSAAAG